ncbi:MAG: ATP phosphoribosyltransferase regulatory subunit [Nitrososphaerota archaeon]|nr:ATP phosphoribosyltransferase regulatory subunit [Nitrososphaerota archaeon]
MIEEKFREIFELWGYREVRTSTVEYFDIIKLGAGEPFVDSIFKFQDYDGKLISIRGEITTQIARMMATRLYNENRVYYIENCIRFVSPRDVGQREFWQAGAELFGRGGAEEDGEIICLALECLEKLGLKANVDIGSISIFRKIANYFKIEELDALRRAISSKSLFAIREIVRNESAMEVLKYIIENRGSIEIVKKLVDMGIAEIMEDLKYFEGLFEVIRAYGYEDRIVVDLSTLREMKYYNGIVFEIFLEGIGIPIGGGGRYDEMMKEFGLSLGATGFAVNIDLIMKAIKYSTMKKEGPVRIYYKEGFLEKAVRMAKELRSKGIKCIIAPHRGENNGIILGERDEGTNISNTK